MQSVQIFDLDLLYSVLEANGVKEFIFIITGLVVTLRTFHGELDQVKKEEPVLLRGVNIVKKLGFPDVIMPGKWLCHG